jgi:hypothetical protein
MLSHLQLKKKLMELRLNKQKETVQTFRQLCESVLSVSNFNDLPQSLGVKKYTITNSFKSPNKMTLDLLVRFAIILKISPFWLVLNYDCGLDKMTGRNFKDLAAEQNRQIEKEEELAKREAEKQASN